MNLLSMNFYSFFLQQPQIIKVATKPVKINDTIIFICIVLIDELSEFACIVTKRRLFTKEDLFDTAVHDDCKLLE